jgi:hypothetical protein
MVEREDEGVKGYFLSQKFLLLLQLMRDIGASGFCGA